MPAVFGVATEYQEGIGGLRLARGRFFTDAEDAGAAAVAVLGQSAATGFFGGDDPVGRFVKLNEQWFRVVGVVAPRLAPQGDVGGMPAQDSNNVVYVPISSAILRMEDAQVVHARRDRCDLHQSVDRRPGSRPPAPLDSRPAQPERIATPATSP